jgi:hypothetical protein
MRLQHSKAPDPFDVVRRVAAGGVVCLLEGGVEIAVPCFVLDFSVNSVRRRRRVAGRS